MGSLMIRFWPLPSSWLHFRLREGSNRCRAMAPNKLRAQRALTFKTTVCSSDHKWDPWAHKRAPPPSEKGEIVASSNQPLVTYFGKSHWAFKFDIFHLLFIGLSTKIWPKYVVSKVMFPKSCFPKTNRLTKLQIDFPFFHQISPQGTTWFLDADSAVARVLRHGLPS